MHGIVKTCFFFSLWSTKADWEREGAHCVCILVVVWTMGRRGKKHTCLQINWFGQEASKEELCVVKQACGEAGMSQQKHHCDHGEDHDAVLADITHKHTCTPQLHVCSIYSFADGYVAENSGLTEFCTDCHGSHSTT